MTKFVKITVDGITARFPAGYDYTLPTCDMPRDVAKIWDNLGGQCVLYTSKFSVAFDGLSCLGLAYITSFLGDHPLADYTRSCLSSRVAIVSTIYSAVVEYAKSTSPDRHIVFVTAVTPLLDKLGVSYVESLQATTLKSIDVLSAELWTIPDEFMEYIDAANSWLMSKKGRTAMDMMAVGILLSKTMITD